jgi:hypothetical protein
MARAFIALIMSFSVSLVQAQSTVERQQEATLVPEKYIDRVTGQSQKLEQALDKKSQKALAQLQKQENKIKKKLSGKIGSLAADSVLANTAEKYKELEEKLKNGKLTGQYLARLDTLVTSLKFLEEHKEFISQAKEVQEKLKESLAKINGLQSQLAKAEEIKQFLRERKELLKQELSKFGFAKELKKVNKKIFYYAETLKEIKTTLQDSKKIERKALEILSKTKLFREFMQKNSILASLFRINGDPDDPNYVASLAGLQTRNSVNLLIQNQLASGGPNAQQQFQQNLQSAQSQLSQLKDKVMKGGGGSSDDIMPEGFIPNPIRSKTFIQRLTFSTDFQSTRHNNLFPVGSDIGVSASYMLNGNSHISLGSGLKIGWGTGFNNIRLSSQGVSFRGGLSWRLRGSLFIAGKYEQNYFSEIRNITQLRDYSSWKTAALLGISKKYNAGKKKGEVTLLYDFLYNRPPVQTQAIILRIGYNIK